MADTNNNSITMREELGDVLDIVYTSALAKLMGMKKHSLQQRLSQSIIKTKWATYRMDFSSDERRLLAAALRNIAQTLNAKAAQIDMFTADPETDQESQTATRID